MRVLLLFLLLSGARLFAQPGSANGSLELPALTIKTNLPPLLNPFKQAFSLGADLPLARQFSADAGVGAFFNSIYFADQKGESYKGLRLRAGLKYHIPRPGRSTLYIGLEGKYNDIRHISLREVFRQGQQYIEILPVERTVKTRGMAFRMGRQYYTGAYQKILIEPYFGMGLAYTKVTRSLPPDAELLPDNEFLNFEYGPGTTRILDLVFGVQIGLALW